MSWRLIESVLIEGWSVIYACILSVLHIFMSKYYNKLDDSKICHNNDCILLIKEYPKIINEVYIY